MRVSTGLLPVPKHAFLRPSHVEWRQSDLLFTIEIRFSVAVTCGMASV